MMTRVMFAPDEPPAGGQGNNPGEQPGGDKPQGEKPATFEAWLESQADDVKTLYASHTEGLRNTVKATRDERDALKTELKNLGKTLEEGSQAKKTLEEISGKLDEATRRADFFEQAAKPEIGLLDVAAAWLIVQAGGSEFIDGRGNVKFDALKEKHPILFGKPSAPPAHAGAGRDGDNQNLPDKSMDKFIRAAAGKS